MNKHEKIFINIISSYINGAESEVKIESGKELSDLFKLSSYHGMIPFMYYAVAACNAAVDYGEEMMFWKQQAQIMAAKQIQKDEKFLKLINKFNLTNIKYAVVKGAALRRFYNNPESRLSGDEDLFVKPDDFEKARIFLEKNGFVLFLEKENVYEFCDTESDLKIELHKSLLRETIIGADKINDFLITEIDNAVPVEINKSKVFVLKKDVEFLYTIVHFFGHFILSGVGVRQLVDIAVSYNNYLTAPDLNFIFDMMQLLNAKKFTACLFKILNIYFGTQLPQKNNCSEEEACELLDDVLTAGIYGAKTRERKQSASITKNAVTKNKSFLTAATISALDKLKNSGHENETKPTVQSNKSTKIFKSVRIGRERVKLMKKLEITGVKNNENK